MSSNRVTQNGYEDNNAIETGIGPTIDRVLAMILDKFTGGNFKELLTDKIVDPITEIINRKIKPYVYVSIGLYSIVIILLIIIIYILLKKNNYKI